MVAEAIRAGDVTFRFPDEEVTHSLTVQTKSNCFGGFKPRVVSKESEVPYMQARAINNELDVFGRLDPDFDPAELVQDCLRRGFVVSVPTEQGGEA